MSITARLLLYAAVLGVVFAAAFGVGRLIDPVHDGVPAPAHSMPHHDDHTP